MRVIEKDPRTLFVVGSERIATIRQQVGEVVGRMILASIFGERARDLSREIANRLAEIDKDLKKVEKVEADEVERIHQLANRWLFQESRRRTPDQLADEERQNLEKAAMAVLEKIHSEKMDGRLQHWQTLCRFDGCEKQPRTSNRPGRDHKARRRNFVFCPGHAGIRNQITTADNRRLQDNANLRVVTE